MKPRICKQTVENLLNTSKTKEIVIWGADSKAVEKVLEQYTNVACIIEPDSERWGETLCGKLRVYAPVHLYALDPEKYLIFIINSANSYAMTKVIKTVGNFDIFYYSVVADKFFNHFSNVLYDNFEKIVKVAENLNDDYSKKIYMECVCRRIMGATSGYNDLKLREYQQYIFGPMFQDVKNGEIVIDCGGYVGDSVEKFVRAFGNKISKIYSFECFEENVQKISEVAEKLAEEGWNGEVVVEPYAVSDENAEKLFYDIGKAEGGFLPDSRLTLEFNDKLKPLNSYTIQTRKIDDIVKLGEKISLIKMDIEGAEYEALKGAEKIIKEQRPRLAISIYHNPEDYFRIFELIQSFSASYKFAVRHHQNNHLDTVLYAWEEK